MALTTSQTRQTGFRNAANLRSILSTLKESYYDTKVPSYYIYIYIYEGFFPIIAGLCSWGMRANGQGGVEHYSPAIIEKNPI